MCGISGFISNNINENIFKLLNNKFLLNHRGPDDFSNWNNQTNTVNLFHNRLSIIDIDKRSKQPMVSSSGRFVISFNGEIYNFKKLKETLIKKCNINFKTDSDTEVLLEGIEYFGLIEFLNKIKGMFAFALHDNVNDTTYLVRDYFGEKPLYYYLKNNELIFSSEIKLFKKINLELTVKQKKINEFLFLGYTLGENTLFEEVQRLLPGHIYQIKRNKNNLEVFKTKYFNCRKIINNNIDLRSINFSDAVINVEDSLINILNDQTYCDRKTGFYLSSGLDSSLLVALAKNNMSIVPETFTLKFDDINYDESGKALKIAKYLKTNHHEIFMAKNDIVNTAIECGKIFCDPISDSSQLPTVFLSKQVSTHVSVILGGDGGDESFSGYDRYHYAYKIWLYKKILNKLKSDNLSKLIFNFIKLFLSERQKRKIDNLKQTIHLNEIYLYLIMHWDLNKINLNELFESFSTKSGLDKYDILDELMYWDLTNYLPNNLLVKIDRSSMNYSLETRSPYLDIDLVIQTWNIDRKIIHNSKKIIQRSILKKYLPTDLISKEKKGFGSPISGWIRNELYELINDEFNSKIFEDNNLINSKQSLQYLTEHVKYSKEWSHEIWSTFVFSQWHKQYAL
jgi:asparagine synthase (glutamine-hydrolysing)